MKKIPVILLILLSILSCSNEKRDENVMRVAISQDVANMDVMKSTSRVLRDILVGNVYEKLFVLSDGEILNELASGYELRDGGRTLEISIREDVKMHDGSLMMVSDVKASLERYISSYEAARNMVGNAEITTTGNSIIIHSDKSLNLFPYLLASSPQSAVIAKEESLKENEYGLITEVIGTGPYTLESFTPGSSISLKRFDDYSSYGEERSGLGGIKHAYFDSIVFNIIPESATRRLSLEKGEVDFINDVMSYDIPALSKNKDINLLGGEESGSIALVFNKKSPLSSNVHFRRSVAYALDYDTLMRACYGDSGYSVHSDYMEKEQTLFQVSGDPYLEINIEKAREELEKSGYRGEVFRILTSNLSNLDKIAVAAVAMLEEIGIKTEIIVDDWVGFLAHRNDSTAYDLFISAFSTVTLPQMKLYFGSSYPGWYESDEKDAILLELENASSIEEASSIWKRAQHFFWSEVPVIVAGHYSTINASRSDISGIILEDGNHFHNAKREK